MKTYTLILAVSVFLLSACHQLDSSLQTQLVSMSQQLDHITIDQLEAVSTDKGFKTMLMLTDSLKSKSIVRNLSEQLKEPEKGIFHIEHYDSLIYLSLGQSDPTIGATDGYLVLAKTKDGVKIESFLSGK